MLSDTNGACWEALLNVAANTADWKISQCFDTRALFQYWVVNDYSCSTRLMWILPDTGHSDTAHLQERAALTGETSALRATNRDSCGTRPHEELQHVLLCRRTALPLPSVLCWGSGRYCCCSGLPARSLRWSQPPRWPLTRPVSSSPAPPVESKSWADRAVRLSFQRSAAETLRASLWDQLQETNTTHSQTHRKHTAAPALFCPAAFTAFQHDFQQQTWGVQSKSQQSYHSSYSTSLQMYNIQTTQSLYTFTWNLINET